MSESKKSSKVTKYTPEEKVEYDLIDALKASRRTPEQKARFEALKAKKKREPNVYEIFAKAEREKGLTEAQIRASWSLQKEGKKVEQLVSAAQKQSKLSAEEQKILNALFGKLSVSDSAPVVTAVSAAVSSVPAVVKKGKGPILGEGMSYKDFCAKYRAQYKGFPEKLNAHWSKAKADDAAGVKPPVVVAEKPKAAEPLEKKA